MNGLFTQHSMEIMLTSCPLVMATVFSRARRLLLCPRRMRIVMVKGRVLASIARPRITIVRRSATSSMVVMVMVVLVVVARLLVLLVMVVIRPLIVVIVSSRSMGLIVMSAIGVVTIQGVGTSRVLVGDMS